MTQFDPPAPPDQRFRLRVPDVAFQVIDGEAILIHFERGAYYSARGVGCEILKLVEAGHSLHEMASELARRSGAALETALATVKDYLERVLAEELVVLDLTMEPLARAEADSSEPLAFGAAELVKYTDLEDLLLLDPIHDVDDAGWPPHAGGAQAAQQSG